VFLIEKPIDDKQKLKVLLVSTEVAPYIKSGGLGDVAGSLPKELKKEGVDIRVCFPKYKDINYNLIDGLTNLVNIKTSLGWRDLDASIYTFDDGVTNYLIDNSYYFYRGGLYGYADDYERFAFFTKVSIEFLFSIGWKPDVIHFNDWQTGLGPIYLNDLYKSYSFYENVKSVYTIHNLQYQGIFGEPILGDVGLNSGYFKPDKLEYYGNVSYMKGGIVYADKIGTVSKTYAHEIQTPTYSYGMDGVLRGRAADIMGIINGIDYKENDPENDSRLSSNYNAANIMKKYENKTALQSELGLIRSNTPIIAMVTRLVDQKGLDILAFIMEELMQKDIQMVVLGTGESRYENMFRHYAWRYRHKMSASITFDAGLAQRIYAASDMFLMPSLFEPCGLGQMIAMRHGSVPIVRRTGGLNDTVMAYDYETGEGTGFVFNDYDAQGLMWAINEALHSYYNEPEHWKKIVENCMRADFSWQRSAMEYVELYKEIGL